MKRKKGEKIKKSRTCTKKGKGERVKRREKKRKEEKRREKKREMRDMKKRKWRVPSKWRRTLAQSSDG